MFESQSMTRLVGSRIGCHRRRCQTESEKAGHLKSTASVERCSWFESEWRYQRCTGRRCVLKKSVPNYAILFMDVLLYLYVLFDCMFQH